MSDSEEEEEKKHHDGRAMQRLEDTKVLDTSLFNYSIYLAEPLREGADSDEDTAETLVDEELRRLLAEYKRVQRETAEGLQTLRERVERAKEPESVVVLKSKNDKEREYLQRTIVMMELKQLAESITMLKYKKPLPGEGAALSFKNRPALWEERIAAEKPKRQRKGDNSLEAKWSVQTKQLYMVSFDSSINLQNTWVDGHVMNLFNG